MQIPHTQTTKVIILLLIVSTLSIISYAAPINVQTQDSQGLGGVYYNVSNNYTISSANFAVVATTKGASSTWSTTAPCNTALTAGHWLYNVSVTAASGATISTITVYIDSGTGYTTLGAITFTGSPTGTCNFYFDAGTSINNVNAIYITIP